MAAISVALTPGKEKDYGNSSYKTIGSINTDVPETGLYEGKHSGVICDYRTWRSDHVCVSVGPEALMCCLNGRNKQSYVFHVSELRLVTK